MLHCTSYIVCASMSSRMDVSQPIFKINQQTWYQIRVKIFILHLNLKMQIIHNSESMNIHDYS